jgi:hypothetical protein
MSDGMPKPIIANEKANEETFSSEAVASAFLEANLLSKKEEELSIRSMIRKRDTLGLALEIRNSPLPRDQKLKEVMAEIPFLMENGMTDTILTINKSIIPLDKNRLCELAGNAMPILLEKGKVSDVAHLAVTFQVPKTVVAKHIENFNSGRPVRVPDMHLRS